MTAAKQKSIVVVGGLAAGPSAAAKAARRNPRAAVTLFEASDTVSYGICEAPYAIGGVVESEAQLVSYTPERLQSEKHITVKTLHRVERVDPGKKLLAVRDLRRGQVFDVPYDRLILATGATPRSLGIEGEEARNVFHVGSRADTLGILRHLEAESPKSAAIIGGGYIGMEMAEALRRRGLDVTIIHRHRLPVVGLELETRERLLEELTANDVRFVTNARTEALHIGRADCVRHVITNRGTIEADIVILALGVRPNVALAKSARVRLGSTGAIATDERQQTSVDGIYAAGDCCEVKNLVSGKPMYVPLATTASRSAWVAGENAAGGRATFKGAIRAIAVKVFGLEIAHVGLSAAEAAGAGFDATTDAVTVPSKIAFMPGSGKVTVRMVFDRRTGRILGANVYGTEGCVLRADTLAVAIQHRLGVEDLARLDLIYAPAFAPLWDPLLVAANQAIKKLDR